MKSHAFSQKLVARILAVLVGAAALYGAAALCFVASYNGLLVLYALVLMSPVAVCLLWRLASLWRFGFKRLPAGVARRAYLWSAAAFFSLTVLAYSLESWRGRRAYAILKQEVARKGQSLEVGYVVPPPVPDAKNICSTPLLRAWVDYEPKVFSLPYRREQLRWKEPALIERLNKVCIPLWEKDWSRLWLKSQFTDLSAWADWFESEWGVARITNAPAETVLEALTRLDSELTELRLASQRSEARWPLRYEDGFFVQFGLHVRDDFLENFIGVFVLRSVAQLNLGQADAALADWVVALRLAQSTRNEPFYFTHLKRLRWLVHLLQPIWEGLATRRWTEAQLRQIEGELNRINLPSDWARAVRGEVYLYMDLARQLPEWLSPQAVSHFQDSFWKDGMGPVFLLGWLTYPRGWACDNQVVIYRFYQTQAGEKPMCCQIPSTPRGRRILQKKPIDPLLFVFLFPRLQEILRDASPFCYAQFAVQSARIACVLERYRLARQEFPDALDALVPDFVDTLPRTPGSQVPLLIYSRRSVEDFTLLPVPELERSLWHGRDRNLKPIWRYSGDGS